jgi:hypothetical protein
MLAVQPRVSHATFTRIVDAARLAPSAENLQPWCFEVGEESIDFCMDLSRQLPSDLNRMLGATAIGTCLENAVLAASEAGMSSRIERLLDALPIRAEQECVPILRLHLNSGSSADPLSNFIESRITSRRMDSKQIVASSLLGELKQAILEFPEVQLHWVEHERLWDFATLVGKGNQIRLEHKGYHAELYRSLRFNQVEMDRTCDGLYVPALQLPTGGVSAMRLFRRWPAMRLANKFGFSRFAGWQAAKEVYHSGAVGFLTVPCAKLHQFVEGGRGLERLWLTATRMGLCFHPTASLPVFLTHARLGCELMSLRHQKLARQIEVEFVRLFPEAADRVMQMAFRIGYGPKPQFPSPRRPLDNVLHRQWKEN